MSVIVVAIYAEEKPAVVSTRRYATTSFLQNLLLYECSASYLAFLDEPYLYDILESSISSSIFFFLECPNHSSQNIVFIPKSSQLHIHSFQTQKKLKLYVVIRKYNFLTTGLTCARYTNILYIKVVRAEVT